MNLPQKIFDGDDCIDKFKSYIKELVKQQINDSKPFNCPELVILPQEVYVERYGSYRKGARICGAGVAMRMGGEKECFVFNRLQKSGSGDSLEALCQFGSRLVVEVKEFIHEEPYLPFY